MYASAGIYRISPAKDIFKYCLITVLISGYLANIQSVKFELFLSVASAALCHRFNLISFSLFRPFSPLRLL